VQEYWEKYKKPIDGKPATVAFNADFINDCDSYEYMYVGFVQIELKNPKEDGLLHSDELDMIAQIEDRLEMEALRWRVGKYVGMINTDAKVHFIYYLKLDFEWSNAVSEAMKHFDYSYTYGSKEDMQGEVYKKLLYPDIYQWQIINNHNACMQLQSQGDILEEKRAIEHTLHVNNATKEPLLNELTTKGFMLLEEKEAEIEGFEHTLKLFRKDVPEFYTIDEITLDLIALAQKHNAVYDGWECSVVK